MFNGPRHPVLILSPTMRWVHVWISCVVSGLMFVGDKRNFLGFQLSRHSVVFMVPPMFDGTVVFFLSVSIFLSHFFFQFASQVLGNPISF